jgi:hypothetical protein
MWAEIKGYFQDTGVGGAWGSTWGALRAVALLRHAAQPMTPSDSADPEQSFSSLVGGAHPLQ